MISQANAADAVPARRGGPVAAGQWAVQVGAFSNEAQARSALGTARDHARLELAIAHHQVGTVRQGRGTLWRARMTGLSRETAMQACEKLVRGHMGCIVLSPESQL